ncbi:MAG: Tfp pilus assembly protein FimT/FimU [Thermoanaerobaculia bacterium]
MPENRRGFSTLEILTVLALVGTLVAVSVPALRSIARRAELRGAVSEIRSAIRLGRSRAIARGANSAIRFQQQQGEWMYALYDDLDGDGVRNDDIKKGVDRRAGPWHEVLSPGASVRIALPEFPVRDPETKKVLPPEASPVRFNASKLCSFGPNGGGTAGSIFLTDETEGVAMVRVTGATGRVRMIRYDRASETWSQP